MRAEIVSIGTELLLGTITDTNAAFLAQRLAELGIDCYYISQVGDNPGRLVEVLERAWQRSDLTLTSGGLGPTQDDLTREAIAAVLGETPSTNPDLEAQLRAFFQRRGYAMPVRNLKQATLITSASPINNPIGTAPGWWVQRETSHGSRIIVAMPGVPFEMKRMWAHEVEPRLRPLTSSVLMSKTLKVGGMGESSVEEVVADLMLGANPTLAPYAKQDGIHLRITAKASDREQALRMISDLESQVRQRLGAYIFGADKDTPASAVLALLESKDLSYGLLEIGQGAVGALTPLLSNEKRMVGAVAAPDIDALARLLYGVTRGNGSPTLSVAEVACAVREKLGADLLLAVSGKLTPMPESDAEPVLADAEVIVCGQIGKGSDSGFRSVHSWRTASSEVNRLFGLAALNALRQYLTPNLA